MLVGYRPSIPSLTPYHCVPYELHHRTPKVGCFP
jgi:hypothetical protein